MKTRLFPLKLMPDAFIPVETHARRVSLQRNRTLIPVSANLIVHANVQNLNENAFIPVETHARRVSLQRNRTLIPVSANLIVHANVHNLNENAFIPVETHARRVYSLRNACQTRFATEKQNSYSS